jgi:hypothetical protein
MIRMPKLKAVARDQVMLTTDVQLMIINNKDAF